MSDNKQLTKSQRTILQHLAAGGFVERKKYSHSVYEFRPAKKSNTRIDVLEGLRDRGLITVGSGSVSGYTGWVITSAGREAIGAQNG